MEAERRNPEAEAKTAQPDTIRRAEEQQRTKADPQGREVEEARHASPIETKAARQHDAPSVPEEQQRANAEPERRIAEEARPTATESARIAARLEHLRILEESRQRVEAEVRAKSQRATRAVMELSIRPAMLEPKASESLNHPPIKRCPKCNATYDGALVAYCAYDATRLISSDDPLFNSLAAYDWARPTLWALVAIIAVGGASVGYLINNYARERGSSAPIVLQREQTENARKDSAVLDRALSGLEVNVPEPEYPEKAKTEGVSGTVTVQVQVNKNGRVISARSSSGDRRLRAAAVKAAQQATFSAEKLAGREAIGTITYVFRP